MNMAPTSYDPMTEDSLCLDTPQVLGGSRAIASTALIEKSNSNNHDITPVYVHDEKESE